MRQNMSIAFAGIFIGCAIAGYPIPAIVFGLLFFITDDSRSGLDDFS